MKSRQLNKVVKATEALGWSVDVDDTLLSLNRHSPAGQDFWVELHAGNIAQLAKELDDRYEGYDPSEEAYLWLDDSGHGVNGAPYDMGDVYADTVWCKKALGELAEAISELVI